MTAWACSNPGHWARPRVSDLPDLRWVLRICNSHNLPVMLLLLLLVQRPHCENHFFEGQALLGVCPCPTWGWLLCRVPTNLRNAWRVLVLERSGASCPAAVTLPCPGTLQGRSTAQAGKGVRFVQVLSNSHVVSDTNCRRQRERSDLCAWKQGWKEF